MSKKAVGGGSPDQSVRNIFGEKPDSTQFYPGILGFRRETALVENGDVFAPTDPDSSLGILKNGTDIGTSAFCQCKVSLVRACGDSDPESEGSHQVFPALSTIKHCV